MSSGAKSAQLQIRVSSSEKKAIHAAAKRAGLDMSAYVLSRLLSVAKARFQECVSACTGPAPRFALAELNSLLSGLTSGEMRDAISIAPCAELTPFLANYVAAMVEYACARRNVVSPEWTRSIMPLEEPVFGTTLKSLRLHLLIHSPPPFRRRNIFIDSSVGEQV